MKGQVRLLRLRPQTAAQKTLEAIREKKCSLNRWIWPERPIEHLQAHLRWGLMGDLAGRSRKALCANERDFLSEGEMGLRRELG